MIFVGYFITLNRKDIILFAFHSYGLKITIYEEWQIAYNMQWRVVAIVRITEDRFCRVYK